MKLICEEQTSEVRILQKQNSGRLSFMEQILAKQTLGDFRK